MLTVQEEFEVKVFNAIEAVMTRLLLKAAGQCSSKEAKRQIQDNLKEIYQSNKRLDKAKCPLTEATINEMIDAIPEELLPIVYSEYLTGSEKEKEEALNEVDMEQWKQETFETVTSYLKKKGFLKDKKAKGFGKKS
jgi:hypothetical protein